jgi:hypothetical protein
VRATGTDGAETWFLASWLLGLLMMLLKTTDYWAPEMSKRLSGMIRIWPSNGLYKGGPILARKDAEGKKFRDAEAFPRG